MKIYTRKQKAEPKKPVHKIQLGKVIYCYVIGLSWIQIETDPKTNWPEMPDYMAVRFAINNPEPEWANLKKPEPFTPGFEMLEKGYRRIIAEIEAIIIKAIKKKTNEQRKTYGATMGRNKSLGGSSDKSNGSQKPKPVLDNKRAKRKAATPMLPFEGDNESAI